MILKPITIDSQTKVKLSEDIPPQLLKTRKSGTQELTYISQNTCVDKLNEIFGFAWSFEIVERWMEPGITQIKMENQKYPFNSKNCNMDEVKVNAEGKRYIELPQLPSAWVTVKLTVPFETESGQIVWISKMASGSQAINGPQATQSINGYKGAQSDALKKAASLFGVALELYRDPVEQEVFEQTRESYKPNLWTDELIKENQDDYDELLGILEDFSWSFDDISYYVSMVTEEQITSFKQMPAEYLKPLIKAIKED